LLDIVWTMLIANGQQMAERDLDAYVRATADPTR
jgi:hypothetical protein